VFLVMTYTVVVFSIMVQGLTISPLLGKLGLKRCAAPVSLAACRVSSLHGL